VSTIAAPLARLRAPAARFWALPVPVRLAFGLAFLTGFSLALRTQAIHARYWIDEGLSVGISSHPFFDVPGVLRQDGSPPLYYLLLNLWMDVFGFGEADTHAMSIAFTLASIPVAFVAGRALFGARAGWFAALVVAMNPFLTYYAQETRMYALVTLLSLCVAGTFGLVFVQRRRVWLPGFAASLALLMYSHNWGLFLAVGTGVAFLLLLGGDPDKRGMLRDAVLAYGAVAILYLPWVPSLLFQAKHTGAPWSEAPVPADALGGVVSLLGGPPSAMAFALAAGSGLAGLLVGPRLRGPKARAVLALARSAWWSRPSSPSSGSTRARTRWRRRATPTPPPSSSRTASRRATSSSRSTPSRARSCTSTCRRGCAGRTRSGRSRTRASWTGGTRCSA
jgi:hypothetical protein